MNEIAGAIGGAGWWFGNTAAYQVLIFGLAKVET
jgi:hypothetical protein